MSECGFSNHSLVSSGDHFHSQQYPNLPPHQAHQMIQILPSISTMISATATTSSSHLSAVAFSRRPLPCRPSSFHFSLPPSHLSARRSKLALLLHGGNGGGRVGGTGGGGGGSGDDGGEGEEDDEELRKRNTAAEAIFAMARLGRTMNTLPADLAAAVKQGRISGALITRYIQMDSNPFLRWLLQFAGFRERLLADDLFLTKVAIECGVGIFTKTAAELERRRDKFSKELDFVFADVVMALIADFMLVWLPAPTISLRPPLAITANPIAKYFYGCPDNAFQIAMAGTSYSFLQRIGAIVRNGSKLFVVGTSASLIGTGLTNLLIKIRKALDKTYAVEAEDVPILSMSVAYGVYMAVSSNLRYQVLAGVVEQRFLEPLLHQQKLLLSMMCFAVRTGNTFLGSLMWVDYARWTGVQKERE